MKLNDYEILTQRNRGYISEAVQKKIRDCRVLIAGCGIGSSIAEVLLRTGFCKMTLVDFDHVEAHNLNRQIFEEKDIGEKKVSALASRLKAIFPPAAITAIDSPLNSANAKKIVSGVDFVFDTIDFLDLPSITYLHDEAHSQRKPLLTAVSAGWGAVTFFFPPNDESCCGFRKLFHLPQTGSVEHCSYVKHFMPFIQSLRNRLDPTVVSAMEVALATMQDGTPCPAPHLAVGAVTVAAASATIAVRYLAGEKVKAAPEPVIIALNQLT